MSSIRSLAPAALLVLSASAAAQNRPIELEWLRNAGAKYTGTAMDQKVGHSVAGTGDLNGDGIADFLIGAPDIGPDPLTDPPGHVYVFFGGNGPAAGAAVSTADAIIVGEDFGWQTGYAIDSVGDLNGDGFDDILVGAPRAALLTVPGVGRAYLLWGGPTLAGTINLASLTAAQGVVIHGAQQSDLLGGAVAGVGDADGDGTPDLLLGANGEGQNEAANARGAAYLVRGTNTLPAVLDIEAPVGTTVTKFVGVASSNNTGKSVAGPGDIDDDGLADLLIGAEQAPAGANINGAAYLVWGDGALPVLPATMSLASLGALGVTINGALNGDKLGRSVAPAGDFNADGFADMALGAGDSNVTGMNNEGRAYIVRGSGSLAGTFASSTIGITVPGTIFIGMLAGDGGDHAGNTVAGGGDTNGDGFSDLLIGAGTANYGGDNNCGAAFLVYGAATFPGSQPLASLNGRGVVIEGVAAQDAAGSAVTSGQALDFTGDVDGDGYADLLVGASRHDAGGTEAGAAWLVRGTPHMIQAAGPVADGGTLNLRAHGAPGGASLTFASLAALGQPIETKFGLWFLIAQLDLIIFPMGANGELFLPLAMPAAGSIPGLVGLTVNMQTLGAPQGQHQDLTYLLAFTIE